MCGIAGTYNFGKENPGQGLQGLTAGILSELSHRGPERVNIKTKPFWSIGIARLSIIDLANKNNIFEAANGKISYVVNGEIFNYRELKAGLISKGYKFRSRCDSEVIGFLYEEYGVDFINMLNGQFAIAIIDERKDKAILIRDHFGIVPLFYSCDRSACYFSSEVKGFRSVSRIPKVFNFKALDQLFTFWTTTGKSTFFQDVHQVRPGCYVEIGAREIKERSYYDLDLSESRMNRSIDLNEAKEKTRDLLTDAVKIRLESSDVEVGTYLSGGVDLTFPCLVDYL